ncbi:ubiquitin carboxyl-terminal hydrolase [Halteromyces radiatus]|uniref:ubiquitin carboxyl-terminal hydrolase n=1 Tax=Halteromyces radiatus TaxID=101107 RepID=UPI0022208834|nr:ubiquitin carboxyl-terminal hydrolase [Halteromyces radiatus]KAI8079923.1 ubiquitin carboxyl-terminal hydrolase [Halteromyces radiatus]
MTQEDDLEWLQVDPSPGLLSQLCLHMGVQNVQVEPVLSIDRDFLCDQRPVYGMMIFTYHKTSHPSSYISTKDDFTTNDHLYFANQVVNNAYAMHALLSILLNCDIIDIGPTLVEFKQFTKDFSPLICILCNVKGLSLSNSDAMRESQNHVARLWPKKKSTSSHVYHYVSYIPFEGYLWELDGFKRGPLRLGPCTDQNWLDKLQFELVRKTEGYQKQHIPYSMWSVIEDRRNVLQRKLQAKLYYKEQVEQHLNHHFPEWRMDVQQWEEEYQHAMTDAQNRRGMDVAAHMTLSSNTLDDDYQQLKLQLQQHHQQYDQHSHQDQLKEWRDLWLQAQDEILRLYNCLGKEDEKHHNYQCDNLRRQHDYGPFITAYLEALHTQGRLQSLITPPS